MEKKKNRKKKDKKIAEKAKAREKAKALKIKLKEKDKKEKTKVKLKEKAGKEKAKDKVKVKVKVKKSKAKGKNPEPIVNPETSKDKRGTPGKAASDAQTPATSSLSFNARTAVSKIRRLGKIEAINNYITGEERVTVREAAASRIASLSGK